MTTGGFEKDLDLNEMNFNIIKNSNAFKSKQGFIEEDELKVEHSMFDPKRRSEEDKKSWLYNR
jgi:hypothetical protein